jgi:hypothetical protein
MACQLESHLLRAWLIPGLTLALAQLDLAVKLAVAHAVLVHDQQQLLMWLVAITRLQQQQQEQEVTGAATKTSANHALHHTTRPRAYNSTQHTSTS